MICHRPIANLLRKMQEPFTRLLEPLDWIVRWAAWRHVAEPDIGTHRRAIVHNAVDFAPQYVQLAHAERELLIDLYAGAVRSGLHAADVLQQLERDIVLSDDVRSRAQSLSAS